MIRTTSTPPAAATSISTGSSSRPWLPCSIAFIAASATAVFELLEPARLEPERRDCGGDALHRLALVAGPALDAEARVERRRRPVAAPRRAGA